MSKRKETRQGIEYRFTKEVRGKMRTFKQKWVHLECGHEQPEKTGGRSKYAESVICLACRAAWDARRYKATTAEALPDGTLRTTIHGLKEGDAT